MERYADIADCWNDGINAENVVRFVYWLKERVVFSKVWTNSDEFAYVIFETMNDRGLSLTQVEMLRSYLLASIDSGARDKALRTFDDAVRRLDTIKLNYQTSKAKFEFFKIYLRGHYAQDFSQAKNANSDFVRIGKAFHRWVRDRSRELGLTESKDFVAFIDRIDYFARTYEKINARIQARDASRDLYLIVNDDYKFTLQPALILASVNDGDSDAVVDRKLRAVSKYLTHVLSWRVWNHLTTAQSAMEATVYDLCAKTRGKSAEELERLLASEPVPLPELSGAPSLNQQNKTKLKVLLSLITEIVASESGEPGYMLNRREVEVEHVWADHYERHANEFANEAEFATARDGIGDLLVLPKSFNASYGDLPFESKAPQYFSQNILAQTLCADKYHNNPGFLRFARESGLPFKPYATFDRNAINERAELYKAVLLWNWRDR